MAMRAPLMALAVVFTRAGSDRHKVTATSCPKRDTGTIIARCMEARSMTGKVVCWGAALVLAAELLVPAAVQAEPSCDCPGSSYSPCHYNFPLVSRFCARFHWHAAPHEPPPFSQSFYEHLSHCPY